MNTNADRVENWLSIRANDALNAACVAYALAGERRLGKYQAIAVNDARRNYERMVIEAADSIIRTRSAIE